MFAEEMRWTGSWAGQYRLPKASSSDRLLFLSGKKNGLDKNTIVWYSTDNGPEHCVVAVRRNDAVSRRENDDVRRRRAR